MYTLKILVKICNNRNVKLFEITFLFKFNSFRGLRLLKVVSLFFSDCWLHVYGIEPKCFSGALSCLAKQVTTFHIRYPCCTQIILKFRLVDEEKPLNVLYSLILATLTPWALSESYNLPLATFVASASYSHLCNYYFENTYCVVTFRHENVNT